MTKQLPYCTTPKTKHPKRLVILKKFFPLKLQQKHSSLFVMSFTSPGFWPKGLETSFKEIAWLQNYRGFTVPWMQHKFCTGNELKCCMELPLLSEGLTSFWLCESPDCQFSTWITAHCRFVQCRAWKNTCPLVWDKYIFLSVKTLSLLRQAACQLNFW